LKKNKPKLFEPNKRGETIIDFSSKKLFNIGAGMVFVETENRNEYALRGVNK
jgi:hypothetical protein